LLHMSGSPQSDESAFSADPRGVLRAGSAAADAAADHAPPSAFDERELEAALQLLVERALYITGATGTALAIPQGDEMVCRASAGACAPAIGARLQVRSGLTGESIARRQLLRCDNAETDPRVNLETCRELGIASIVVLPLFRRNGEVRGLFELFSDHPYAFEERDLVALERMAALTTTALDLAERRQESAPAASARADEPAEAPPLSSSGAIAPVAPFRIDCAGLVGASVHRTAIIGDLRRSTPGSPRRECFSRRRRRGRGDFQFSRFVSHGGGSRAHLRGCSRPCARRFCCGSRGYAPRAEMRLVRVPDLLGQNVVS
jgi:hypothetical protein